MSTMSLTVAAAGASEVLLRDVHEVFQCRACHAAPAPPPVYLCRQGHTACCHCYSLGNKQCSECGEPLFGRHLPLEEVLLPALFNLPQDPRILYEDMVEKEEGEWDESDGLGTTTGQKPLHKPQEGHRMASVVAQDCYRQMLSSGRTIQCPFPCILRVTTSGLYRHFSFQHPEVYFTMLCKNRAFPIIIPHELVARLDHKSPRRCVYIFIVDIGDSQLKDEEKLVSLYNMNPAELLSMTDNMSHMLQRRKYLALLTVSLLRDPGVYGVWVTALYDFSPVRYTLRCNDGPSCVSYQGRPKSLQMPVDLHTDCLVLPSSLLSKSERLRSENLELTLVFHLDIPFPQELPPRAELEREPQSYLVDV